MQTSITNLKILFEDNHLIVINKQSGDLVQGDKTGDTPLSDIVKLYIKNKYNKPGEVFLGVTHRIDRPTSGIVVFAKTSKALSRVNKMFAEKNISKTYWAIVKSPLLETENTLIHWLSKNSKNNKSTVFPKETPDAKKAILHYKELIKLDNFSLVEVSLETGRPHQIRAQLAAIGNPIKGDLKYGAKRSNPNGGIYLHARKIQFAHPVTQAQIDILAPLPEDRLWDVVSAQVG